MNYINTLFIKTNREKVGLKSNYKICYKKIEKGQKKFEENL